jgi:hypothetical protein
MRLTSLERSHGKNTRENTLVVTVEQTTQAGKASNAKDLQVLDQGHRSTRYCKSLAASQCGCLELGSSTDRSHVEDIELLSEEKVLDRRRALRTKLFVYSHDPTDRSEETLARTKTAGSPYICSHLAPRRHGPRKQYGT